MKEIMLYCKADNEYYPVVSELGIEGSITFWVKAINSNNPTKRANKHHFVIVE